ncbi:MAG: sialidase family protein [Flectobacillus sp.]|nr:sialidase family protein [Flectobacillus sp.]
MKKIMLLINILLFSTLVFSSCKNDISMSYEPIIPQDTSLLERNITEGQAIQYGNELIKKQVAISKFEGEIYAHDSKLLIVDGIGYCAYYGNDASTQEGAPGQAVRLSVFDIENPRDRVVYDVFKSGINYSNGVKFDNEYPCYTPVLFRTKEGSIRILSMVYQKGVSKYYYRDFDIKTKNISEPKICKIVTDNLSLIDFDIVNVRKSLKVILGENYRLSTDFMFMTSEPVEMEDSFLTGLTIGKFTVNWKTDEGTTIIAKTDDQGKTFNLLGTPDPSNINPKYNSQNVEAAFIINEKNEILMLGRNSLGGMVWSKSTNKGLNFSTPYSLNEACQFNIRATKPNFNKINDGYLTIWNTNESFVSTTDRTVLEIRYGKNSEICGNAVKIKIKSPYGCHYPSLYKYKDKFYLTFTTDTRRFNANSTGEIVFVKLPF